MTAPVFWKAVATVLFLAFLCVAISQTDSDAWLTLWFPLLFFVGIPVLLLVVRDVWVVGGKWRNRRGPLLLHTCAVFAALVGYGVGWMAVDSPHPKAHLHQWMVIIFPLFVYATPLLMVLHGLPLSRLKYFYFGKDDETS
jgi:hypothetical protein